MGIRLLPPDAGARPLEPFPARARTLSRRGVLGAASSLGLFAATAGHLVRPAAAAGTGPKPIPGTIDPFKSGGAFHVNLPPDGDPSTFTDWRGTIGVAHVGGTGTVVRAGGMATPAAGTPAAKPLAVGDQLTFDADVRFIQGTYVGEDGQPHEGTFGFI